MMTAHLDQLVDDVDAEVVLGPASREANREELRWLHNEAIGIRAKFPEFFPGVLRPSFCPFDAKPPAKPGTLAGLMQSGRLP